jgi:hypothetical protein
LNFTSTYWKIAGAWSLLSSNTHIGSDEKSRGRVRISEQLQIYGVTRSEIGEDIESLSLAARNAAAQEARCHLDAIDQQFPILRARCAVKQPGILDGAADLIPTIGAARQCEQEIGNAISGVAIKRVHRMRDNIARQYIGKAIRRIGAESSRGAGVGVHDSRQEIASRVGRRPGRLIASYES